METVLATARDVLSKHAADGDKWSSPSSLLVVDLVQLRRKIKEWYLCFPRVKPFFAVKCNPNSKILEEIARVSLNMEVSGDNAANRIGFDCASEREVDMVAAAVEQCSGASWDRLQSRWASSIIFANPCKPRRSLEKAKQMGVKRMTFDNADELLKVAQFYPAAELLLRLDVDGKSLADRVDVALGTKFGVSSCEEARSLLIQARDLSLTVVGLAFHVGSGCRDLNRYVAALEFAHHVFNVANEELQFTPKLHVLDIGGGFPGISRIDPFPKLQVESPQIAKRSANEFSDSYPSLQEVAATINPMLDKWWCSSKGFKVIAEPGRFFVQSTCTLFARVIEKFDVSRGFLPRGLAASPKENLVQRVYRLAEGVHGTFKNSAVLSYKFQPAVLDCNHYDWSSTHRAIFRGCSDFEADVASGGHNVVQLPDLLVGDYVYFANMGAYSIALASESKAFPLPDLVYIQHNS